MVENMIHVPWDLAFCKGSKIKVGACTDHGFRIKGAFASVSSSGNAETSSIGTPQFPIPPQSTPIGSPLLWIGVGVGLSALFSWKYRTCFWHFFFFHDNTVCYDVVTKISYEHFDGQMAAGNRESKNSGFSPGSPYAFPSGPFPSQMATSPVRDASQPTPAIDIPSAKVEATTATAARSDTDKVDEPKRYAFVDVSPEEISQKDSSTDSNASVKPEVVDTVSSNGSTFRPDQSYSKEQSQSRKTSPLLSVDALEKMMEDPTVQKMVYPYLPEEMRNPTTFKWMLQNPEYRQQLQDMLNNMGGGGGEWDNRMMDSLKNFDLSSPEVKQQFEQIGLTPEEVISKIMANPDVALAFQNPRVQAAIMDCSQNPFSIAKYQNDKEVMDVLNKISELFPGVSGPL
ncbi:unnamed protein product [Spirodela intermedia]|uniref:Protein TIC 40, chloroplastic n=1 Tax=Spirodela intermedia TaxID=51605 RepID=A0A7I8JEG8_SPIIN|nr:unnamed protein product [Spirodela intermedia]CAA6667792.1 unnamed protein product [Spirodela intermedia]